MTSSISPIEIRYVTGNKMKLISLMLQPSFFHKLISLMGKKAGRGHERYSSTFIFLSPPSSFQRPVLCYLLVGRDDGVPDLGWCLYVGVLRWRAIFSWIISDFPIPAS